MEGGRRGLAIVASAFLIQVFAFGLSTSIGVYNVEFLDYFDNDSVGVSLVAALNWSTACAAGPLASYLITKIGYRKTALLGSSMAVVGVLFLPLLPSLPALWVGFGFVTGVGSGLVYVPSHVLSGLYYNRYQSLATGIAASGAGLGDVVMPIGVGKLIEVYGWKMSLLVVAGLQLHLFVFSALLKSPPAQHDPQELELQENEFLLDRNGSFVRKKSVEDSESLSQGEFEVVFTGQAAITEKHDHQTASTDKIECTSTGNGSLNRNKDLRGNQSDYEVNSQDVCPNGDCEPSEKITIEKSAASPLKRGNKKLRHVYLFTDFGFDVYFLSNILLNASSSATLSFAPEYTTEKGISDIDSALLLTILGIGSFTGGIVGGVIGNIWANYHIMQYVIANGACGIIMFSLTFCITFEHFAAVLVLGGFSYGMIYSLLVVVLIDIIGTCNLSDGFGFIMLANGIGLFIGPILAGYIRQASGTYDWAFYSGAIFSGLAGASMWLIPVSRCMCPRLYPSQTEDAEAV